MKILNDNLKYINDNLEEKNEDQEARIDKLEKDIYDLENKIESLEKQRLQQEQDAMYTQIANEDKQSDTAKKLNNMKKIYETKINNVQMRLDEL